MNRLKNLVNNDQGKTLNTAEQRFARIQGLVVLFGETKIYCDQNDKLYINNTNDMIDKHGKEKIDTLVALNNATQLFKRITKMITIMQILKFHKINQIQSFHL